MAELRTKGAGVASFIEVIRERFTPAQLAEFEAHLPPACLALFKRRVLAVEWIPMSDQMPLGRAVLTHLLGGNEEAFLELVHESSRRDLAGIYKLLIRVMSPEHVAERASKIFRTYVDGGDMSLQSISRANGRARFLIDVPVYHPDPHAWLTLRGYIEAPLLMTGAKNLKVRLVQHEVVGSSAKLQYEVEYDG